MPGSSSTILLIWLLSVVAAAFFAGRWGYNQGEAIGQGRCDRVAVVRLEALAEKTRLMMHDQRAASRELRSRQAEREALNEQTDRQLRSLLAETASARADCRLGADIMRELAAARERAATAATGRADGDLSGAGVDRE